MSIKNLIFACLTNFLNIIFLVGLFHNGKGNFKVSDTLGTFEFYNYLAIVFFYIYALVSEIMILCKSAEDNPLFSQEGNNTGNRLTADTFMKDHFFKFCFCLQGFAIFNYLHKKFEHNWPFDYSGYRELSLFYSSIILYVIMMASLYCFFDHKPLLEAMVKEIFGILVINFSLFILTSIITSAVEKDLKNTLFKFSEFILAWFCNLNSYQFYHFLLNKKLGIKSKEQPYQKVEKKKTAEENLDSSLSSANDFNTN